MDAAALEQLLTPVITGLGYEIVRVKMVGGERTPTLQIMVDRADGATVIVEDCAKVSRAVSELLDTTDPIEGEYSLEVSSPGIDRPLTRAKDYARWAGHEAKIELVKPVEGRKRFTGKVQGIEGDRVTVVTEDGPVSITLADIAKAKLILTDALIEATGARG